MKDEFGTVVLAGGIACHYAIQDKDSVLISGRGRKDGKCLPAISPDAIGKSQGDVSLVMPDTLLQIGEEAFCFSGCRHIRLNSQLKEMGRAAFEASAVADVEFGEALTTIGQKAFFCCKDLKNVRIPSNVKIVDDRAFASSELSNVTFDGHGTLVSRSAFAKCPCADSLYKNADIVIFPDTEQIRDRNAG